MNAPLLAAALAFIEASAAQMEPENELRKLTFRGLEIITQRQRLDDELARITERIQELRQP